MVSKSDPAALATQVQHQSLPPVEQWKPPLSGEMDLRITRDGTWFHEGQAIRRESLVRLFSTLLRRDEDGDYYLLTPREKWRIQVDDAPFLAVMLDVSGEGERQVLCFETNVGDKVLAGPTHPMVVEYRFASGEPSPYVHVRGRLRALISRSVFLELADLGMEREVDGEKVFGVWSQRVFFPLGCLEE